MIRSVQLFFICVITAFSSFCEGQEAKTEDLYTFKVGDPNGIGKWYMGREIAYVMGFQGIDWLERPEREEEENTSKLISNMKIKSDDTLADIGAGSGYHVFKMAKIANKGFIYAVDIQEEMLDAIIKHPSYNTNQNIETVLGAKNSVNLEENSVDKVLMVDVYHEFSHPFEMLSSIKKALRKDGKIYLIEYRAEDPKIPIKKIHKMSEAQAIKEMKVVGFKLEENLSNLPWQHCMVFIKDE